MGNDILEGAGQVLKERNFCRFVVVKRNHLIKNGEVSGLLDIGGGTCNEPERIVIETTSDIHVALFGERLILVIGTAVRELGGGDIDDTLSCALRDQMNETEQILAGITESHAAAGTGFIIGSGTGHVECYHALILVPDVDHTVNLFIGRGNNVFGKQMIPVSVQLAECFFYLLRSLEAGEKFLCRFFVDHARFFPLLVFRVFCVAEYKYEVLRFARSKCYIEMMSGDR